jgi:uncharacterized membrane protein
VRAVLGRFTFGYVVSVGIAATVFILALKYAGSKFNLPVITPISKAV